MCFKVIILLLMFLMINIIWLYLLFLIFNFIILVLFVMGFEVSFILFLLKISFGLMRKENV